MLPKFTHETISLRELFRDRELWTDFPEYQREGVWDEPRQQALIDTILRGMFVPEVVVVKRDVLLLGVVSGILDGQQRIRAIISFMDDKFETAKRFNMEPRIRPMCPGTLYSALPEQQRKMLDAYHLRVAVIYDDVEALDLGLQFRRLQQGIPLTFAERLWSYLTPARQAVVEGSKHPFWSHAYGDGRKRNRKEVFHACLLAMMIEGNGPMMNLTNPRLPEFLVRREGIEDALTRLQRRLTVGMRLYPSGYMTSINHIVPSYQALMFLDEAGYSIGKAEQGILGNWWLTVIQHMKRPQDYLMGDPFSMLRKANSQAQFWIDEFPKLVQAMNGVPATDRKRIFDHSQRFEIWLGQDRRCKDCGNEMKLRDLQGAHIIPWRDGGETTIKNGVLLCHSCHVKRDHGAANDPT